MKDIKDYINESEEINESEIDESYANSFNEFIEDDKKCAILFHALRYALDHVNDKNWPDKYVGPEDHKLTYTTKEAEEALEEAIDLIS